MNVLQMKEHAASSQQRRIAPLRASALKAVGYLLHEDDVGQLALLRFELDG